MILPHSTVTGRVTGGTGGIEWAHDGGSYANSHTYFFVDSWFDFVLICSFLLFSFACCGFGQHFTLFCSLPQLSIFVLLCSQFNQPSLVWLLTQWLKQNKGQWGFFSLLQLLELQPPSTYNCPSRTCNLFC